MRQKNIEYAIKKALKREHDSHKGQYGHVLIIAGSRTMSGAAVLSARAALRSGSGLVTVAVPRSIRLVLQKAVPEALCIPLPETKGGTIRSNAFSIVAPYLKKCDVLALGPGLTVVPDTKRFIKRVLLSATLPVVLDADGMNALEDCTEILAKMKTSVIITPHPKEFARLTRCTVSAIQQDRRKYAVDFSEKYGCIVVLKGHKTIVANKKNVFVNTTGNAGLAKGGSGDVLTGMIAAFIGQHCTPYQAASYAVYVHGFAADRAVKDIPQTSLMASDVIVNIPRCLKMIGL